MAITTITGLTAQRMIEIEQASVVTGTIEGDNLVLTTKGGKPITAGNVRGPRGLKGDPGGPVNATATVTGGIRLGGNIKGPYSAPLITGNLDNTVSATNATATSTYGGSSQTLSLGAIFASVRELLATHLKKSGTAHTVWSGTEAQYNALPTATRNAAGFIAVVS